MQQEKVMAKVFEEQTRLMERLQALKGVDGSTDARAQLMKQLAELAAIAKAATAAPAAAAVPPASATASTTTAPTGGVGRGRGRGLVARPQRPPKPTKAAFRLDNRPTRLTVTGLGEPAPSAAALRAHFEVRAVFGGLHGST